MTKPNGNYRKWFPTYTGKKINLRRFKRSQVDIVDIAHHLSLQNRFGGATARPATVAQHSVIVSRYVGLETNSKRLSLWGLLHDAAEAYLNEMKIGVKDLIPMYSRAEDRLLQIIISKYGLTWPMPEIVHKWDWIVGCNEAFQWISKGSPEWFGVEPVKKIHLTYWEPMEAESIFLQQFKTLTATQAP